MTGDVDENVLWFGTEPARPGRALTSDQVADVCVVGAGIAGLSTAYFAARAGLRVVVLDHGRIGGQESGRTTAHLAGAMDAGFVSLECMHGRSGARLAAESHAAAIDRIEAVVAEEDIACGFERLDGFLFDPPAASRRRVEAEFEAARRAGLAVDLVDRAPIAPFDTGPAIRYLRQAQLHPLAYLHGLAAAIERDGGRIYTDAHVTRLSGGRSARVRTRSGHEVGAESVVVATSSPINDRFAIHTKQAPYRTYVIAGRIPRGSVHTALYWDTVDPGHYVRVQADHAPGGEGGWDLLIVGGEDAKAGASHVRPGGDDDGRRFGRLEAWARRRFPTLETIVNRWSGTVFEPIDGLAYIGRNPMDAPNVFVCTGDAGHGMTHGTIAGLLITDLILGRKNRWERLYDPSRLNLRADALIAFLRESASVAAHYAERLRPAEVAAVGEIPPGHGAVLQRDLDPIAVYRDPEGGVTECSAVCTHLGGVVHWNTSERRWECPCHGSRFDRTGGAVNGPAVLDLAPVRVREPAK